MPASGYPRRGGHAGGIQAPALHRAGGGEDHGTGRFGISRWYFQVENLGNETNIIMCMVGAAVDDMVEV